MMRVKEMRPIEDLGEFKVYGSPRNVSVGFVVGHRLIGTMNADDMGMISTFPEGRWWLARANIVDPELRGMGLGSKMMDLMKQALTKQDGFKELLVAPGGYGSDPKQQIKFYLKQGFKKISEGGYLWHPEQSSQQKSCD